MRLICPNCSAQYEIDASLIPDEGRDVQCSNCGHTWFELPPAPPAYADAPEPDTMGRDAGANEQTEATGGGSAQGDTAPEQHQQPEPAFEEPEPEQDIEPERQVAAAAEDFDDTAPEEHRAREDEAGDEEPSAAARAIAAASEETDEDTDDTVRSPDPFAAATPTGAVLKRRPADEAALEILREEAERELSQRRAPPTTPIETQTDMGLEEISGRNTPSRALRARMAREETEKSAKPDRKADARVQSSDDSYEAPRRDLLPDIDEINSSLKPRSRTTAATPENEAERRKGFRSGFLLMVALAVVMIFAYAWAPTIAGAVPSLESPLLAYVDWANGVRDWLDGFFGA